MCVYVFLIINILWPFTSHTCATKRNVQALSKRSSRSSRSSGVKRVARAAYTPPTYMYGAGVRLYVRVLAKQQQS